LGEWTASWGKSKADKNLSEKMFYRKNMWPGESMRPARKTANPMRVNFFPGWGLWSGNREGPNIGATFTHKQKIAAYNAFTRGWRKSFEDEPAWSKLSARGKVKFLRAKIRDEIFALPEKQPFWRRIWKWLGKAS
jgi:hypothetical protein